MCRRRNDGQTSDRPLDRPRVPRGSLVLIKLGLLIAGYVVFTGLIYACETAGQALGVCGWARWGWRWTSPSWRWRW